MYDPFAPAPQPGMYTTASAPVTQVAPAMPTGVQTGMPGVPAATNALHLLAQKFRGNPAMGFPGGPQMPGMPPGYGGGNTGVVPPGMMDPSMIPGGWHQAIMDWRAQRPDRPADGVSKDDWRQGMQDWRALRPDHRSWGGFGG